MERYNPFASTHLADETEKATSFKSPNASEDDVAGYAKIGPSSAQKPADSSTTTKSSYSTSFPDPFGDTAIEEPQTRPQPAAKLDNEPPAIPSRSNSVSQAQAAASRSVDDPVSSPSRLSRQTSGLGSFLSRATSVTSSSVTDKVSGAVGSVRNAVDSLSSQIQQAVPSNASATSEQQQSTASYLASRFTSATGQLTSSGLSSGSLPAVSKQRVVLILDGYNETDWAQQFSQYRRLTSGATSASQSALNFLSQLSGSLGSGEGGDQIEQADFRDVTIMANQGTSTATIFVATNQRQSQQPAQRQARIIRPEFVVVRQRTKEHHEHLRSLITGLDYCLIPMFEPAELWNLFQSNQLIFSKLLKVQRSLGKENFPLIPQIFFQTHLDLLAYLSTSTIMLPCLVRTGHLGKGKIKIDNLQMLQDFASIMATSGQSCTIEPYLDVKCDLIVQKLGVSLKLFKRSYQNAPDLHKHQSQHQMQQQYSKQPAARQTSLGSGVLSNLISTTGQQPQALFRRNSASGGLERLSEVGCRYKSWIEAISREFEGKLDVFSLKIAVASNDREYIVGLRDCTLGFFGSQENQDEDRRSFVELLISHMNTVLPKTSSSLSRNSTTSIANGSSSIGRRDSDDSKSPGRHQQLQQELSLGDKRKFVKNDDDDDQIGGLNRSSSLMRKDPSASGSRNYGQLNNRSKSVSVNQYEFGGGAGSEQQSPIARSLLLGRRSSDRSDSMNNDDDSSDTNDSRSMSGARQASMSQSLFDQTSTAFSSLHKQSLSFFKRLDGRGDFVSNTPPSSAKSDKGFDKDFMGSSSVASGSSTSDVIGGQSVRNGYKSQSIDGSTSAGSFSGSKPKETPPKPPPPLSMGNRQSSLAAYSSGRQAATGSVTPNSTPVHTRQNSAISDTTADKLATEAASPRSRVVRQGSALSAFMPHDPELALAAQQPGASRSEVDVARVGIVNRESIGGRPLQGSLDGQTTRRAYDSASINSGDSNSTGETTTAEDTMNNLKRTFASILGDKCE